jgi:hypothetical protein
MLEPRATAATLAGTTLLAYGSNYSSETGLLEGMGLSAYTIEGEKRFHHFEAEPIWLVETAGSHAYVHFENSCAGALVELPRRGPQNAGFWFSTSWPETTETHPVGQVLVKRGWRRRPPQPWASMPTAHNPEVAGSNPAPAASKALETGPSHSPILKLGETLPNFCPTCCGRTNESREALLNDRVPRLVKVLAP